VRCYLEKHPSQNRAGRVAQVVRVPASQVRLEGSWLSMHNHPREGGLEAAGSTVAMAWSGHRWQSQSERSREGFSRVTQPMGTSSFPATTAERQGMHMCVCGCVWGGSR
jgi:hypothetical protein